MAERNGCEELCPYILMARDAYSDAINRGQYHYSEREFLSENLKSAERELEFRRKYTKGCEEPQVLRKGKTVKIQCPALKTEWTPKELRALQAIGHYPSIFHTLEFMEENSSAT